VLPKGHNNRVVLALVLAVLSNGSAPAAGRFFFESWPRIDMSVAGDLRAVEIEGKRLEYYDVGKGTVVLVIHGSGTDATDWREVITPLARQYRLIIPDAMIYPFDARALWRLLDYLEVEKVALMGHSGGGGISRNMYFMRPSRVWALDLDGPAAAIPGANTRVSWPIPPAALIGLGGEFYDAGGGL